MARAISIQEVARLGGLTKAAMYDGLEGTEAARSAYRRSFEMGHGCALCPRIEIPAALPEEERSRRAAALRKAHFARMGMQRRRLNKAA